MDFEIGSGASVRQYRNVRWSRRWATSTRRPRRPPPPVPAVRLLVVGTWTGADGWPGRRSSTARPGGGVRRPGRAWKRPFDARQTTDIGIILTDRRLASA